jgi:hypothetical protein
MSRRARTLRYGVSIALVLAGVACGALIPGSAGGTSATVLVGIGLVGVVSLLFYEVGLTEDRERARQQRMGEPAMRSPHDPGPSGEGQDSGRHAGEHQTGEHQGGRLRPLDRRRGQRRRLR